MIGLVTQPGVEFDHHKVIDYVPAKAVALSRSIESVAGMVFEAHSTDYQTPRALADLVRDHFAILKVGPGVTFALREVLWALSDIASELGISFAEGDRARGNEAQSALLAGLLHESRAAGLRPAVQPE